MSKYLKHTKKLDSLKFKNATIEQQPQVQGHLHNRQTSGVLQKASVSLVEANYSLSLLISAYSSSSVLFILLKVRGLPAGDELREALLRKNFCKFVVFESKYLLATLDSSISEPKS